MRHATETDHLAAMATLVTRHGSLAQTLRLGVAWGVGHTLALMLFAGAVLLLGQAISPELEQGLETAVGAMLFVLGADVLRRLIRDRIHVHAHRHPENPAHVHAHRHRGDGPHARSAHRHAHRPAWPLRALAVGVMHGLAGSAALVILSLRSVPSVALGLGYITLFGIGSIVGMALLSVAMTVPLRFSAARLTRLHHAMTVTVGLFSCALGASMVLEIGWLQARLAA